MNQGEDQRGRNMQSGRGQTPGPEKGAQQRRPISREERMRRKRERLKRRRRIAIAILCGLALLLILIGVGIVALVRHFAGGSDRSNDKNDQASDLTIEEQQPEENETKAETEPVSITISAAGDCTLGTDEYFDPSTSLNAYYDSNGPAYFFQNVKSIFEADDLTIVNMEGTLTEETTRQDKTYAFKGPAEYTQILTDGDVEAANLANNHSHDYGDKSYTDTIAALDAAGITNFGYDRTAVMDVNGVKVGLVGTYELAEGMGCED